MRTYLDFEKPIAELESKVAELKALAASQPSVPIEEELAKLENKAREALEETYSELTPWQKTQVARHPDRPHFRHYIDGLVQDFTPLAGDRFFAEDQAILGGIGRLSGRSVMVIGHEKGSDTEGRIKHNFGMARPEGYRKAARLMEMADRFSLPVISLVDTAGAYPGIGAEERGQAEAIARNLREMARLPVPVIAVCIGEGGSGGALALGVANQVFMLENAVYSVITPESCASIIYRDSGKAEQAAAALKLAAPDMLKLGLIDGIIPEPAVGAHEDHDEAARLLKEQLIRSLAELSTLSPAEAVQKRYDKFRMMGNFFVGT
jgi:acetyl-CoA carboxylase carboxyl transferase subunit alpha